MRHHRFYNAVKFVGGKKAVWGRYRTAPVSLPPCPLLATCLDYIYYHTSLQLWHCVYFTVGIRSANFIHVGENLLRLSSKAWWYANGIAGVLQYMRLIPSHVIPRYFSRPVKRASVSINGTPNVTIVVAKRVPDVEVVRSAELKMTASVYWELRPNRETRTVWVSATVHTPLRE